jgi:hypothetical protein
MVGMKRREFIQLTAAAAAMTAAPAAYAQSHAPLAISGPIAVVPKTNEPYRGENEQPVAGPGLPPPVLIPFGYVEEEYFISGTVAGQPYSTSLLVRKPSDPSKFSGLVAVETIHAQGAIPFWGTGHDVWMPGGHAWVAVASQRIALEDHAKRANPARYASLNIPDVAGSDAKSPPAMMTPGPQDRVSQDIMTQVGTLLKDNVDNGPLRGMNVRYLVMGGASQTGGTTLRYIAQSHAAARRPDGKPIYDGYFPAEAFSAVPVPPTDAAILHPCTEGDVMMTTLMPNRSLGARPDSDAPNDRYRHYEVAGASHVVTRGITDPHQVFSTLANALRPGEQLSQFPDAEIFTAFLTNFVAWVMDGTPPPKAERIALENGQIVRDEFGNARGGVRTPYVDLPTVHFIASAPTAPGENFFRHLIGLQEPIPRARLLAMYHTRKEYLSRFDKQIDAAVAARFLLSAGAATLKAEEAKSPPI